MNRALPLCRLEEFEARLERTWWGTRASWANRRDCLAIGLGLCGLRCEEILSIQRRDFVLLDEALSVRTAKDGVPRNVIVGASLIAGIQRIWRERPAVGFARETLCAFYTRTGGGLGYEAIRRRCYDLTKRVFAQPFSPHCLRHTAAVREYKRSHDVVAVQRLLGHRSLQWTTVYLRSVVISTVGSGPTWSRVSKRRLQVFDPDNQFRRSG